MFFVILNPLLKIVVSNIPMVLNCKKSGPQSASTKMRGKCGPQSPPPPAPKLGHTNGTACGKLIRETFFRWILTEFVILLFGTLSPDHCQGNQTFSKSPTAISLTQNFNFPQFFRNFFWVPPAAIPSPCPTTNIFPSMFSYLKLYFQTIFPCYISTHIYLYSYKYTYVYV